MDDFKVPAPRRRGGEQSKQEGAAAAFASAPAPAPAPAPTATTKAVATPSESPASSLSVYTPPLWSSVSLHPYSLTVLRCGVQLDSVPLLSRPYFTVGRLPAPHSHISLPHASISRQHAVIQHRDDGRIFILDRGSSHGTFVNKRRVAPHGYVELHVGDFVRFGDSERLFLLEGPDELRTAEKELRRSTAKHSQGQKPPPQPQQLQESKEETQSFSGAGSDEEERDAVRDDEEDEDDDGLSATSSSSALFQRVLLSLSSSGASSLSLSEADSASLSGEQRALVHRVQKRQLKLANLQAEVDALQGKEVKQGGLSEGQQAQKERNEQRIHDMEAEVADDLDQLRELLHIRVGQQQRGHGTQQQRHGSSDDEADDSGDDFYDRTRKKKSTVPSSTSSSAGGLTRAASVTPLAALPPASSLFTAEAVQAQLRRCEELRDALRVVLGDLQPPEDASGTDSLDAFMGQVEQQRRAEKKERVKAELRALQSHYEQLRTRLKQMEADARVQRFRAGEGAAAVAAPRSLEEEREERENGEDPAGARSTSGHSERESVEQRAGRTSSAGGGMVEALARVRQRTEGAVSGSSTGTATPTKSAASIGPTPRPTASSPTAPTAVTSSSPSAGSSSSSLAELARRMDAVRASSARIHGDSSIGAALKRRMEIHPEAAESEGTDDAAGAGGLLVTKRRTVDRDRSEAEDLAGADDSNSSWRPPTAQIGDGRTERNARLGY